jgi:chemotaxis protein MotB
MAKKKHEEEHENHERWLVTYADMITLLMVLFIVLFSMATLDAQKFSALKDSLAGVKHPAPSVLEGGQSVIDGGSISRLDDSSPSPAAKIDSPSQFDSATSALQQQQSLQTAARKEQDNLEQVHQEIQSALNSQGMGDAVQFRRDADGLVITIATDKVLFDSGQAVIRPNGRTILNALVPPLTHLPNPITIEGHTDNVPINTAAYPTNWELSGARAVNVLRYMVEQEGFPASRISSGGYADQRPVVPNDSAAHRAQNRRVEVIVHTLVGEQAVAALSSTNTTATTVANSQQNSSNTSHETFDLPTLPARPVITTPSLTTKETH